ncbi:hypothetical protein OMAG_000143 [Candidatus Omnitrophus magneticus]|uniref:Uncharacterized protein n=1 Tax=Candidatus Omnitrophus magneticus TaxID=1609969 RepID=A0A0F0CV98_9BACT|nr:hypothetical protein OMAG_000143 [Candidatus Omnitrophus magneticus]
MANLFNVEICSSKGLARKVESKLLKIRAHSSGFSIMANHAPLMMLLAEGTNIIIEDSSGKVVQLNSTGIGFFQFFSNKATILLSNFVE